MDGRAPSTSWQHDELLNEALVRLRWLSVSPLETPNGPVMLDHLSCKQRSVAMPTCNYSDSFHSLQSCPMAGCCLAEILRRKGQSLTPQGKVALARLVDSGFQLLRYWPRAFAAAVSLWLGDRFFLVGPNASSRLLQPLHSVACSRLGRQHQNLPPWPSLLEWAVQSALRDSASVLVVPETTLADELVGYCRAANVPFFYLHLPNKQSLEGCRVRLVDWLVESLYRTSRLLDDGQSPSQTATGNIPYGQLASPTYAQLQLNQIELSPELTKENQDDKPETPPLSFDRTPVRDRAAIALADRISVISVRSGGQIAELLTRRLIDERFPTASCFVAASLDTRSSPVSQKDYLSKWLDQGAIAYLCNTGSIHAPFALCRRFGGEINADRTLVQPCFSLQWWNRCANKSGGRYLIHCTRGNAAAWPQESEQVFLRRVWWRGEADCADPFISLQHILYEQRIRGSSWLNRSRQPTVSLSQVPLVELLSRRTFRQHLGRWDWEPYGLIFVQSMLADARPVIYAAGRDFQKMTPADQPFFQPNDGRIDWLDEQEWRVLGDIDLRSLSTHAALVFTKTQREAWQLARLSPFPVIWIES